MKKIIIVALLLLLCMGLIGSFSTLGNTSGGGAGESSTIKDPAEEFPDDGVYKVAENLTFYNHEYDVGDPTIQTLTTAYTEGQCFDVSTGDPSDRIYLGYSEKDDQRLIAFSFDDLEIGKTYLIKFIRLSDYPIDTSEFYYRFNSSGNFSDFTFYSSDDTYSIVITPTAATFQLGILYFSEAPSNDTLQAYASAIKQNVEIWLYEVDS